MATILFLHTDEIEKIYQFMGKDFSETKAVLVRLLSELLIEFGRGYHCHTYMVAFANESDAIGFGLRYIAALKHREELCISPPTPDGTKCEGWNRNRNQVKLSTLVKLGCIHGQFLTMGPHKSSGRADYFGKVVNRAARVASAAAPGTIYLGRTPKVSEALPRLQNNIRTIHVGIKPLKGVQEDILLYECLSTLR